MQDNQNQDKPWYLILVFENWEMHELSGEDLLELLREEWAKDFNGLFIGRDIDGVNRLGVFFSDNRAFVGLENFVSDAFSCSYNPAARSAADWDEMVRLSPRDREDFSYRRCEIISKEQAWEMLEEYLLSGRVRGLYLLGADGRPVNAQE